MNISYKVRFNIFIYNINKTWYVDTMWLVGVPKTVGECTDGKRLNNLFMLADLIKRKGNYDLLPELGLENADLLRPNIKMGVYDFRDDGQGKSVVERLEFISHPLMGYDFQLFGSNIDKLYDEADKITR